jgi:predicted nucleic acid-binding protein
MTFIDANIILRVLFRDDERKARRCFELLQQAERGELELTTSESVIAKVVYVLSSPRLYNLAPGQVAPLLRPVLNLRGLRIPGGGPCLRALELFEKHNIDFEDALILAHMEAKGITGLLTYDRHFDRIAGITRHEP